MTTPDARKKAHPHLPGTDFLARNFRAILDGADERKSSVSVVLAFFTWGAILDMFARKTPEIFRAQITALLNRPDATPILAAIRCPTLVLCGREDSWSPVAQHEEIAARISGSELAIIERCGHMAPMERPEEVTTALDRWFAKT